jgi:hypothetical protein
MHRSLFPNVTLCVDEALATNSYADIVPALCRAYSRINSAQSGCERWIARTLC